MAKEGMKHREERRNQVNQVNGVNVQAPRPRPGPRRSIDLARRAAADARRRSMDLQVSACSSRCGVRWNDIQ